MNGLKEPVKEIIIPTQYSFNWNRKLPHIQNTPGSPKFIFDAVSKILKWAAIF